METFIITINKTTSYRSKILNKKIKLKNKNKQKFLPYRKNICIFIMLNFYIFIIFKINNNYRTEASLMKIMKKEKQME